MQLNYTTKTAGKLCSSFLATKIEHQWLKCNERKGTPFPHLQFMAQSVPPHQIVTMLEKGTLPQTEPKPECTVYRSPASNFAL